MLRHWACLTQDPATMALAELQDCMARLAAGKRLLESLELVALGMLALCVSLHFVARWRLRVLKRQQRR